MGKETWANGNIAYIPLMRRWMKEAGWDVPIAIGEYDHAGPEGGLEISGAVAQVETWRRLRARSLPMACTGPTRASTVPVYFAFKMFRNPDGKRPRSATTSWSATSATPTALGSTCTRTPRTRSLRSIITNKRAKVGARLTVELGAAVPAQKAARYEYSAPTPRRSASCRPWT